jgi:hypothetical protein
MLVAGAVPCGADGPVARNVIQVAEFTVAAGLDVPREYLDKLYEDLIRELRRSELFEEVAANPDNRPTAAARLRLTGEITEYKKGNRMMRYMVPE